MNKKLTAINAEPAQESIREILASDPVHALVDFPHLLTAENIEYGCLFHPSETLEFAFDRLNPEQFDYCCQRSPRTGFARFGDIMNDRLFATCFKYDPTSALVWQTDRLTKRQFDRCVREFPLAVLEYHPCHHRFTIKHLKYLIRKCPQRVLEHAECMLTDAQFESCSRRAPLEAMVYCGHRLKGGLLRYCSLREPEVALAEGSLNNNPKLFDQCCHLNPGAALRHVSHKMTAGQFAFCVREDPWSALVHVPDRLPPAQLLRLASDHTEEIEQHLSLFSDSKLFEALVPLLEKLDIPTRDVISRVIAEGV